MDDSLVLFDDEPEGGSQLPTWHILTVDDDAGFQRATAFAISEMEILGRRIEITQAFSNREAAMMLAEQRDFALVLLDVVMETEDAGLRLVKTLREVIGNAEIRIVLLTGEPGMAPVQEVMRDYDINDYWSKSELSAERLRTVLTTGLRSYTQLKATARARRGLQMIVESSNALFCSKNTRELSAKILSEIASLLDLQAEGIVCVKAKEPSPGALTNAHVISASGRFYSSIDSDLDSLKDDAVAGALRCSLQKQATLRFDDCTVLFFPRFQAGADYACYVATERTLDDTELELLEVFSASISRGLYNVALFSRLEEMAYQDDLLKIPNRNALIRMLDMTLNSPNKHERVLVLIDIDNFSGANTAFGTGYGDFILGLVANRLRETFDGNVLIARVRDDLFAILGPEEQVRAEDIVALFRRPNRPYEIGQVHSLSSVTLYLRDFNDTASVALQDARLTLKQAKQLGHDQHVVHDPQLQSAHAESFRLLLALRDAVASDLISIELQPQVDLRTGVVTGVEALARWYHADGKSTPPLQFIPLAEATGYILPLGDLLMRLSLQAARRLGEAGYGDIRVAINVSATQLLQRDFIQRFTLHLEAAGVTPGQVELEITESVAMRSFELVCEQLLALREMGVTVSIDDFGTGFSSLSYLRQLPANRLKIDRSFVQELSLEDDGRSIAEAIIQIAQRVGMTVIAEGVEDQEQAEWLKQHNCAEAQGFLFAKPMPLERLLVWLGERNLR
ncbi:putative bifunctional diguanylate cyclase/phosphodiesterase [Phytopseudomonas seleniipraecipitans]|uniref:Diguanylate cyclase (GGDEF) domain-containing protein n=1 Tax=Phytopseudomonas seleniipraecipitans TaxID=640205 RepID=A0A1G7RCE2_9GAMM|nr:EAL domain-containing protein [Pseudomonas seleniipraecipitans]SDG08315.1 diguanylate cyclase (GGDEF) domain-containing protein [Pseudomonas seleniipraecipitans]